VTRIVAGAARGRRLAVPPRGTRPTTDRVREALFNVLAARLDFDGMQVLDLYAGSGALGLEALSRGATAVVFVENDRRAADVLSRNIESVGLAGATLRRAPVAAALAVAPAGPVDLVLADPPYETSGDEIAEILGTLDRRGWVGSGTIVVVERPASAPELIWPTGWTPWPPRRYGDTRIEAAAC
jgi:16S rRNA (guanine(966)-N(2))-methyltransferase RsmD